MKIALVYDAIYPYKKGGAERRFYEIGKRLCEKEHEVHLYGMKFWDGEANIRENGMYLHGICDAKELYTKRGKRSIFEAIYFGFYSFKLLREDIDIIDCCAFPYFSLFSCKLISIIKKIPLYSTWHEVWGKNYWNQYLGWKGFFGYFIEKLAITMPTEVISVSQHTTSRLKNELSLKKTIYTIPNGIDTNLISKIKSKREKSDIIYAGRLLQNKNINVVIRSIKLIKREMPRIKCLVIGDGPEKNTLEALTHKLNLEKNINFLGFLENQNDVYALMKSSKVFVLPSTREGFGIVVIEANACGIPVITINHKNNAAKQLVENGKNGYVCELNELEISRNIMKILKSNNKNNMKKSCIELSKKFDWDRIINEIEGVYNQ